MAQDQSGLPRLTQSRSGTARKIMGRIRLGEEIRDRDIASEDALKSAMLDRGRWHSYNIYLLKDLFDKNELADEYSSSAFKRQAGLSLDFQVHEFKDGVNGKINRLQSIIERLPLFRYSDDMSEPERAYGTNIFIVHGHDVAARSTVSDFLRKLDLNPIVLQEQETGGRTIIENFEAHAENSGFAVILLTGDDMGYPSEDQSKAQRRARQNVVLEFGYFLALLGRERVRVLYEAGVEMPSDLHGLLYIEMDSGGAWQFRLAKEIKAAGFEIDLNLL